VVEPQRGSFQSSALLALVAEIERQDSFHDGYTATRDSLRLALATVEDEVQESLDAWREDRCKCGVPQCSCSRWPHLREEALQAAAIIVRMVRAIDTHQEIPDAHAQLPYGQARGHAAARKFPGPEPVEIGQVVRPGDYRPPRPATPPPLPPTSAGRSASHEVPAQGTENTCCADCRLPTEDS